LRILVMCLALSVAVVSASGLVVAHVFHLATPLKYAITVAGPLLIFFAVSVERPALPITALLVIAAPLADANAAFLDTRLSPLVPLLVLGFGLTAAQGILPGRRPALRWAALLAIPLLAVPFVDGGDSHVFESTLLLSLLIAWLVSQVASDPHGLRVILVAVVIQAVVQAAIAIYESRTGHALNFYASAGTSNYDTNGVYKFDNIIEASGTLGDPISLGNAIAISVPVVVIVSVIADRPWKRWLGVAALAIVVVGLGLSFDRTAWIGAVVGALVSVTLLPRALRRRVMPWTLAGLAAVAAAVIVFAGASVVTRFDSIFAPTSTQGKSAQQVGDAEGEQTRLQLWSAAIDHGFLAHPVAGVGIGQVGQLERRFTGNAGPGVKADTAQYQNAASTYLQLIAEAGLLAVVLLAIVFGGSYADLRAGYGAHPVIVSGLAGALLTLFICWVTDVVVFQEPVAACVGVLFGLVAGASRGLGSATTEAVV
jgi:O-antigen ligase